jgi:protocatechuate 3,4-dioxygenase, beta subunit
MIRVRTIVLSAALIGIGPAIGSDDLTSGPPVGDEAPAFDPQHVAGPDQGSHACPMCKYGYQQGALIWVNTDDLNHVAKVATRLEREIHAKGPERIRAFVIYMNPYRQSPAEVEALLSSFAKEALLSRVAVAYVPSPTDKATSALYGINPAPSVKNTVIVYRNRKVFEKFINLTAAEMSMDQLVKSVERAEAMK